MADDAAGQEVDASVLEAPTVTIGAEIEHNAAPQEGKVIEETDEEVDLMTIEPVELAQRIMTQADANRNGLLTQSEFAARLQHTMYSPFYDWLTRPPAEGRKTSSRFKAFDVDKSANMDMSELEAAIYEFHDYLHDEEEAREKRQKAAEAQRNDPAKMRSYKQKWDGRRPRPIQPHHTYLDAQCNWQQRIVDTPSSPPRSLSPDHQTRRVPSSPSGIVPDASGRSVGYPGEGSPVSKATVRYSHSGSQANDCSIPGRCTGWPVRAPWASGWIDAPCDAEGRCQVVVKALSTNVAPGISGKMTAGTCFAIQVNPATETVENVLRAIEVARGVPPENSVLFGPEFGSPLSEKQATIISNRAIL